MLRNFKGAIFDMDETLGDSLMIWDILWEKFGLKFLNHKGFRPFEEDEKIVRTKTLKDAMEHIHSKYNIKMYNKNFIYLCLIFGLHLTRIYKDCRNLAKGRNYMFIEELYFYYVSLKTEFVDIDTYSEWLNKVFLECSNKDDILLELQFCTDNIEKTLEEMQIYINNRQISIDYHAVMKMIISELKEQYRNKTTLYQLTKKLYNIWTVFPENISSEKPFIMLNSIDDPWSWNDKEQVKQSIEKLIEYYN